MIIRNDMMPQQSQGARKGIAQNSRADMTDMHRLGNVWRAEVQDYSPRFDHLFKKQMFSARRCLQALGQRSWLEPKIQKPGAGDLDFLAQIPEVQFCNNLSSHLAWVQLARLG